MKTKIYTYGFSFLNKLIKRINSSLVKVHQRNLRTTVLIEARNYARKNLPSLEHKSIEPFLDSVRGVYKALEKDVCVQLQGRIQKMLGAITVSTINKQILVIENVFKDLGEKIEHLTIDKERLLSEVNYAGAKKQSLLLNLVCFGDCVWIISSFLVLGDAMIWAIIFGFFLGIISVAALKYTIQLIKELDEGMQRLYLKYTAVGYLLFSLVLALLRYWFFYTLTGDSVPFFILNPFVFVVFNMVAGVAIAAMVLYYYPTKTELNIIHEIEKIEKEIAKLKLQEQDLTQERTDLLKEREYISDMRVRLAEYESVLLKKVDSFFNEAVGKFKNENISKRTDNVFPPAFALKHDPLSIFIQNDLLFT